MQFLYSSLCRDKLLELGGDEFTHLSVRRERVGSQLFLRNLKDDFLYEYELKELNRRTAVLELISKKELIIAPKKEFHLLWCLIDPKVVEKTLPMLNEIGVSKITFLPCARSQKNFRLDSDRLKRILIASCEQCGRSAFMEIEELKGLEEVIKKYGEFVVLDFGGEKISKNEINRVLIGCEGGFSDTEREMLKNHRRLSFECESVLRSESAAVAISSILLL